MQITGHASWINPTGTPTVASRGRIIPLYQWKLLVSEAERIVAPESPSAIERRRNLFPGAGNFSPSPLASAGAIRVPGGSINVKADLREASARASDRNRQR